MTQRNTFTCNYMRARWGGVRRPIGCGVARWWVRHRDWLIGCCISLIAAIGYAFMFLWLLVGCTVNLLNVEVGGKSAASVPLRLNATTQPTSQVSDEDVQLMTREVVADSVMDYVVSDLVHQLQTASPKPQAPSPKTHDSGLSQ